MTKLKLLLILALLCTGLPQILAQAKVTSMTETMDIIPAADQRRDFNKQLCALVKVQVVDDITDVEGNVMGNIVNRGVEKWVYMAQGSRNMKIHLKNNLPLRVVFRDYKINSLKGNCVYELVIDAPKGSSSAKETELKGNKLQLQVEPANATVTIWADGQEERDYRPQDDGTLTVTLPYGRYHYRAVATGYETLENSVFVNDEDRWEEVRLERLMGRIMVTCPTKKAELLIDDVVVTQGKNGIQWQATLEPGKHKVEVRRKGLQPQSRTVYVVERETKAVAFDDLKSVSDLKKALKAKEAPAQPAMAASATPPAKPKASTGGGKAKKNDTPARPKGSWMRRIKDRTQAQTPEKKLQWAVRGGVNLSDAAFDADGDTEITFGAHLGGQLDWAFSSRLHLNTSLLLSMKGYDYNSDWYSILDETGEAYYLTIPVQLATNFGKFQVNFGPYLAIGLDGSIDSSGANDSPSFFSYYEAFDYGLNLGVAYNFTKHFFAAANYELGLGDYPNRTLGISIGYKF